MGGPPLVLWVMAHDWANRKTRAFLYGSFGASMPLQIAVFGVALGWPAVRGAVAGAAFSPAVVLGSLVGLAIGNRFSKPLLRRLAYGLLVVIALNSIVPALW